MRSRELSELRRTIKFHLYIEQERGEEYENRVYAHLYHTGGTDTNQFDLQISKISTKRNRTDLACQCGPAIEPYLLSPRNKLPLRPYCSASITPSETLVCQCGLARALCRYRQSRALLLALQLLPSLYLLIIPPSQVKMASQLYQPK